MQKCLQNSKNCRTFALGNKKKKTCFINQLKFYNYDTNRVKTEY